MPTSPKVGIVYLSYHSESYFNDLVSSLKKMTYPKDRVEFIIVDNMHPEFGSSVRAIEDVVLPLSGAQLPKVTLLPQETNLGFSGGNNVGIQKALDLGCEYVFLHNDDGFTDAGCIEALVSTMEADKKIGAAQALLLLYPETDLLNSSGNSLQYLGIGHCNNFRKPLKNLVQEPVTQTNYASGAAIMMRADLLKKFGLWDVDYFLYHEDIEYSLRLKLAGFRVVVVHAGKFYHKYNFSRNKQKFYFIERNRFGLWLSVWKWPTLILFLPIGIIWELGMLFFALKSGWIHEKISVYVYWLKLSTWKLWLGKRKKLQHLRVVTDHELLNSTVDTVQFEEKSINNPLLKYVANPLLQAYGLFLRLIIFW